MSDEPKGFAHDKRPYTAAKLAPGQLARAADDRFADDGEKERAENLADSPAMKEDRISPDKVKAARLARAEAEPYAWVEVIHRDPNTTKLTTAEEVIGR